MRAFNHHAYCVASCYGGCDVCSCHNETCLESDWPAAAPAAPTMRERAGSILAALWASWVRYSETAGQYHGAYPF